jgi:hypothetical protein
MNIAIMFNGQFRWFESFKKSFLINFQPALNGHNIQYFAYFWNENLEGFQHFKNLCQPMIINLEDRKTNAEIQSYLGFKTIIDGTLPYQLYCAYKVFLMLKEYQEQNNKSFDLYIRMRPDIFFLDKVNFDSFDQHSVYSKKCHPGSSPSTFHCDYAYFTKNYEAVKKIAEFGTLLDRAIDPSSSLCYREFISQNMYCPEELLARHINNSQLSTKYHNFDVDLARHHL